MSDFPYIILIVTVISINGMAVDYERTNDHINRGLIVDRIECHDVLNDVFNQATVITKQLKKCERRKRR